ncbi:MAG: 4Fe-4S dicluster domain-containing protein [Candidatus Omnitrophica bacterium]|nr:4Fe-4S dicluster domain-containing protein [Candidatus Omnitrophota bacterium]
MNTDKKELYISRDNFFRMLDVLKNEYEVYIPVKKGEKRFYKKYVDSNDNIVIGEVRAFEPLKAFFTEARESVAKDFSAEIPDKKEKPYAVVGVKACDLKGFKVHDHVFQNHDYNDPFYIRKRQRNLIISADCTFAIDTCFCLALGVNPYPERDFDINLSQMGEGFVVIAGSPKGEAIIEKNAQLFEDAKKEQVAQRAKKRTNVVREVEENIKKNSIPRQESYKDIIKKNYESSLWEDEAKTCVECGACNTICPTCHCFLLYDQKDKDKMERLRIWDSCMIKDFARVAGGANPRSKLWMRLRNRFEKKFDFFPKVADVYACTGCGRCVSACPAKIDIRKVLKRLVKHEK